MNKILIVIPCLNEEAHLERLVEQLVQTTQHLNRQIVIAEGGSTDRTLSIARSLAKKYPFVAYVHNVKKIQSAGINLAVKTYGNDCDYFIRIDAHSEYPDNFCDILLQEAITNDAQSVVVAMNTLGKDGFQKAVAAAQNSKLGNGGSAHRSADGSGKWVDHGHHALMNLVAFDTVGGYDENFSHNEDAELDLRLSKAGYKIWMTGQTNLIYYPRSTIVSLYRQYFKFGQGRARTIFKHKRKPRIRQMIPLVIAPAAALFVLGMMMDDILMLPLLIWAALCLAYGFNLARKQKDLGIATSGVAIMVMHLSWSCGFWLYIWQYFTQAKK